MHTYVILAQARVGSAPGGPGATSLPAPKPGKADKFQDPGVLRENRPFSYPKLAYT